MAWVLLHSEWRKPQRDIHSKYVSVYNVTYIYAHCHYTTHSAFVPETQLLHGVSQVQSVHHHLESVLRTERGSLHFCCRTIRYKSRVYYIVYIIHRYIYREWRHNKTLAMGTCWASIRKEYMYIIYVEYTVHKPIPIHTECTIYPIRLHITDGTVGPHASLWHRKCVTYLSVLNPSSQTCWQSLVPHRTSIT